ncbi:hypothetical protein BH10BAC3_BH10BAC3_05890 [soil metagenome]
MLTAIVLAAGMSKRMGGANKLLLPYHQSTVIRTVVENILDAGIGEVIVVVGYEAAAVKNALKNLPVIFIDNPGYETGMTGSIQQGVQQATGNGYLICLADMVLISPAEYAMMNNHFEQQILLDEKRICLPLYNNQKGNPVIFSSFYKTAILNTKEPEGCKQIVQASKENIAWVQMPTDHVLTDMDDYETYQRLLQ